MLDVLIGTSLAATTIAKVLVDVVKNAFPNRPTWVSPVLAIVFGILAAFTIMLTGETELTRAVIAQSLLAGILAGGSAVGVTELQRNADK
jgi:TRAP-type C4-dicarboxylate transport system permease small subunit